MKGMKKLFALLAVLTMALTLTPMVTPVAAALPAYQFTANLGEWTTKGETGVTFPDDVHQDTASVLAITGKLSGVGPITGVKMYLSPKDAVNEKLNLFTVVNADGENFTAYVFYDNLVGLGYGEGEYVLWCDLNGDESFAEDDDPILTTPLVIKELGTMVLSAETIPSGTSTTITGTVAPKYGPVPASIPSVKAFLWKQNNEGGFDLTGGPVSLSSPDGKVGTFTFTEVAFQDEVGTKYRVTVQKADDTAYNEYATYKEITVTDADIDVSVEPTSVTVDTATTVTITLVGITTNEEVTGTILLGGTASRTFSGTATGGQFVVSNVTFPNVGTATVLLDVNGLRYFGKGYVATIQVKEVVIPPVTPQPTIAITLGTPKWMTEKDAGLSTSTTMVLQVPGTISGTVADNLVNADITYNGDGIPSILIPQGYNFTLYFKYADLASFGEDGVLEVAYEGKSDSVPVNLFKITTKDAVSEEVTSGQKVTITGTVAPVQKGAEVNLTNYKVYAWRDEEDLISSATVSTTGTFSLVFYAYGNLETEYEITVQPKDPEDYNGAPYYSVVVSKLAEVKVNPIPDTIVAGSDNVVEFQLFVGTTTLAKHSVTGTITLGSETKTFTATTDDEGKATATGVNFSSIGVADVTVKVSGPNYYGTGTGKLAVSASEEYGLSVKWPTTWEIGEENEVQFITPMAGYTFVSVKVKVSGPVVESGEQLKGTSTVGVTPKGYGTLTLNVEAVLKKDSATTAITKSFSTTIPGYLATADPEELVRGATQTLTVVVKDAYGNPVNNALVQFFSPVNSDDPIAKLDGTATTVVNNGTYKLTIVGSAIKKADEDAYVEVRDSKGRQAYIPVAIAKSPDIKLVVDKEEIVLGPKTTITVTISSPVALAGTVLSIVDEEGEDTELISYMLSGSATVQTITLPVNKMPKEAGVYQLLAESANYVGTATLTFVEPVITASPAELLAGATTVVTFTSANVKDLTTVTKVTATGAISKITAKTASDVITATVVTGAAKGTGTVTFVFDSKYEFALPLTVIY
ncbi:MAG TPA: hypothetical protein GX499_11150, partial [Clostridiales bacterium]|nr:hypothetical protein [Clostridiales bacterium]